MKIQICSVLHLEFHNNREWLKNNPLIPKGEILIIAGDTYYLEKDYSQLEFINKVSEDFEQVFLIPGNHEYYGGFDISTALYPYKKEIKKNVFLLNNCSININNVLFIFSTMWSKIEKNVLDIIRGMADFRKIRFKEERFSINHFNMLHEKSFEFITNEVNKEGKKVIVTHHLPSEECNVEEFKDSTLNNAFCVEKTRFILNNDIDYWIYGHSHRNKNDFKIGGTKMITNQLGYIGLDEHYLFDSEKVIEI